MQLHLFEGRTAALPVANWGKFAVGAFGPHEYAWRSAIAEDPGQPDLLPQRPLLATLGWSKRHILVLDLQTGEGGLFRHGGHARADLNRRRIWVCVLFEAFLGWVYEQDLAAIADWPRVIHLDAEFAWHGYRRPGMYYDRRGNRLRLLPGPGMCHLPW